MFETKRIKNKSKMTSDYSLSNIIHSVDLSSSKKRKRENNMENKYTKYNWTLTFWNGDNFRKWKWYKPCPCGCDTRDNIPENKLVGYYSGGLGLFGFTLMKRELNLRNSLKNLKERGVQI